MSDLLTNARLARTTARGLDRALIVTGDYLDAKFWDTILNDKQAIDGPKYWVERGKKGNLLGALQAYSAARSARRNDAEFDQIHMLFGSGTQLAPYAIPTEYKSRFPASGWRPRPRRNYDW